VSQLPLFSEAHSADSQIDTHQREPESERLLVLFRDSRLVQGAHPQSVRREVFQLRAVMREAGAEGRPVALGALFADLALIARVLREPRAPIARSTGRARLLAVQRFIRLMGRTLGRDPATEFTALDALLPARRSAGWHTTGTLVAGSPGRRRRRGPSLGAAERRRLVDAAGMTGSPHAQCDRALVALHCFSGLRPEEIVRMRWENLVTELTAYGRYGLTATVERGGRRLRLLLLGPIPDSIVALAWAGGRTIESMSGTIFCARGEPDHPLSYRAARDILRDACRLVGLPTVESTALRSARAHWLGSRGLSSHEVAAVLGLASVGGVNSLFQRHAALGAHCSVREMLTR